MLAALLISSITIVSSRTTDCNYVVDFFPATVNPPSLSPTASPTPSPTLSPTNAPTNAGETSNGSGESQSSGGSTGGAGRAAANPSAYIFVQPYTFNYCYSYKYHEEPLNSFSFIYECIGDELKRTMYWDNLDCSGTNIEETTIQKSQQGTTVVFQCSADINCDTAKISMQYATTTVMLACNYSYLCMI